jgi:hypothetical protein
MNWRKLREARMFGIGIRAYKPRPRQSLVAKAAKEYARKYRDEMMKPHLEIVSPGQRAKSEIELTPELEGLAERLLEILKQWGETVSDNRSPMGGGTALRYLAGDFSIYGMSSAHWFSGITELTAFKNGKCLFACVFRWKQGDEDIAIMLHDDNQKELEQLS